MESSGFIYEFDNRSWRMLNCANQNRFEFYENLRLDRRKYKVEPVYAYFSNPDGSTGLGVDDLQILLENMMLSLKEKNPDVLLEFIAHNKYLFDKRFWEF